MILFMWQDDIIDVAQFIDAGLQKVHTLAGSPVGDQASDQPRVGSKDVMIHLLLLTPIGCMQACSPASCTASPQGAGTGRPDSSRGVE